MAYKTVILPVVVKSYKKILKILMKDEAFNILNLGSIVGDLGYMFPREMKHLCGTEIMVTPSEDDLYCVIIMHRGVIPVRTPFYFRKEMLKFPKNGISETGEGNEASDEAPSEEPKMKGSSTVVLYHKVFDTLRTNFYTLYGASAYSPFQSPDSIPKDAKFRKKVLGVKLYEIVGVDGDDADSVEMRIPRRMRVSCSMESLFKIYEMTQDDGKTFTVAGIPVFADNKKETKAPEEYAPFDEAYDIPVNALFRPKVHLTEMSKCFVPVCGRFVEGKGITIIHTVVSSLHTVILLEELFTDWEMTLDGGKTIQPCGFKKIK